MERDRQRSSVRSRDSVSISESDPREKIKDCCRKIVAFMCTQVGVGGLIVGYAIVGAFCFMSIENRNRPKVLDKIQQLRNETLEGLWNVTGTYNTLYEIEWKNETDSILKVYQSEFALAVKQGYDGRTPQEVWTFPAALMFCLSVFTMIGYGNMYPKSDAGKVATVIYATFGIPLYILYFMNMGKILANIFKWLYRWLYECSSRANDDLESADGTSSIATRKKVIVPSTACLWVISFYVAVGTIMFAQWEKWDYLDAAYFVVTSLCKIGIGDFVPGANIADSQSGKQTKLVINFVYLLLGMGLVAMCYNLMREEVRVKIQEIKEDTRLCLEDLKGRFTICFGLLIIIREAKIHSKRVKIRTSCISHKNKRIRTTKMYTGDPNMTVLPGGPIRLKAVKGYPLRQNNVIYCPPLIKSPKDQIPGAVVYFGGDVQDLPESMEGNRDTKSYVKYNLENTAVLLRETFPKSHIIVVQPTRMEYTTFSCFDNFVRGNCAGIPDHSPMHNSLEHLEALLSNLSKKLSRLMSEDELIGRLTGDLSLVPDAQSQKPVDYPIDFINEVLIPMSQPNPRYPKNHFKGPKDLNKKQEAETEPEVPSQPKHEMLWWRETLQLDKCDLALIGFSKGCVVLNQFIYEFHYIKTLTPDDSSMMRLVSRIKDMYWLDGGHGGGKNTWITSRSLLETLCRLNINIHVHVSPYQVQDDHRPWIRKEEKAFTDLLKRLGANLTRHLHSSDSNVSNLFTHFEVLHGFKKYQLQLLAQQQQNQQIKAAMEAAQAFTTNSTTITTTTETESIANSNSTTSAPENYTNNSNNSSSSSSSSSIGSEDSETDK
uniref:CSON006651 protein n=1 Tax=Culicoides sonorensis TaxID=179676 RepID=A0A336MTM9_CULSO